LIVARCSFWCKTGALSRLSFTRMPLKQDTAYRHSQSNKGFKKLHRRVINERVVQEQLDMMKLAIADLESADSFGSLGVDCDVDEQLKELVEDDQPMRTPARKRSKSLSLEVSKKTDEHSEIHSSFSDRQVTTDVHQEREVKGPFQARQPASKRSHEHRISVPFVPLEASNQMNEHLEIYNKFPSRKSLPDLHPDHKDWSEKFGSLSDDVDKFLDKYVTDTKRYSCHLITFTHLFF